MHGTWANELLDFTNKTVWSTEQAHTKNTTRTTETTKKTTKKTTKHHWNMHARSVFLLCVLIALAKECNFEN